MSNSNEMPIVRVITYAGTMSYVCVITKTVIK